MELMSVMLDLSDETIGAAMSRGTPGSGQMSLAMAKLQAAELEDWAALLIEAQIASLEQRRARFVSQEVLANSIQAAIAALPDSEETRMKEILGRYQSAADRDACWAGRVLFRQGGALPEPARSHMALGLVQP